MANVFALLLPSGSQITGLRAIREREDELINVDDFQNGIEQDAANGTNPQSLIKDGRVYSVRKTYFDLDNNRRILLCDDTTETFDDISEIE